MSVRPSVAVEIPEMTARMARASNPAGTTAMWVRDRLDGLWDDEDFAGWCPREGRPGISPAQLATVSVLQFLPGLSDRDAAGPNASPVSGSVPVPVMVQALEASLQRLRTDRVDILWLHARGR
jgi:hypothetical protein